MASMGALAFLAGLTQQYGRTRARRRELQMEANILPKSTHSPTPPQDSSEERGAPPRAMQTTRIVHRTRGLCKGTYP